jgi:hypothetical protein
MQNKSGNENVNKIKKNRLLNSDHFGILSAALSELKIQVR